MPRIASDRVGRNCPTAPSETFAVVEYSRSLLVVRRENWIPCQSPQHPCGPIQPRTFRAVPFSPNSFPLEFFPLLIHLPLTKSRLDRYLERESRYMRIRSTKSVWLQKSRPDFAFLRLFYVPIVDDVILRPLPFVLRPCRVEFRRLLTRCGNALRGRTVPTVTYSNALFAIVSSANNNFFLPYMVNRF